MVSIRTDGWPTPSAAFQTTRSTKSMICCHGTPPEAVKPDAYAIAGSVNFIHGGRASYRRLCASVTLPVSGYSWIMRVPRLTLSARRPARCARPSPPLPHNRRRKSAH